MFNRPIKLRVCLTANAKVATVLGSIPASSDTVKSKGQQMKQCGIITVTVALILIVQEVIFYASKIHSRPFFQVRPRLS